MRDGTFSISSLENAVKRLGEILARYKSDVSDDGIRDSVIQRFEFTYSIALKTLKKYFIERAFVVDDVEHMSFNDMIRTANRLELLKSDLEMWTKYRNMRNLTSHTYDESIAKKVVSVIPDFYEEVCFLFGKLKDSKNA